MKVPKYWASHKLIFDYKNKSREVFRFGWSDTSQNHAKNHAMARCNDARNRILADEKHIKRFDGKGKYLHESGLPIREKVVQRYDSLKAVTTINSYGATCLNVENVLILDIDYDYFDYSVMPNVMMGQQKKPKSMLLWGAIAGLMLSVVLSVVGLVIFFPSVAENIFLQMAILCVMILIPFLYQIKAYYHHQWQHDFRKKLVAYIDNQGGYSKMLDNLLQPFLAQNPSSSFNLYQTPQGFRLIALHDNFTANDEFTQMCFEHLPVDVVYQRLCKVQQCFRARTTGKPWRMGISQQFLGYQDFWREDILSNVLQKNQQWLKQYQNVAQNFSACHFVKKLGNAEIHPHVAKFIELHDDLCKAHSQLSLA